jgi:hypothetical protein
MTIDAMVFWTAAGVLTVPMITSIGWLLRNERKMSSFMTYEKYAELAKEREQVTMREITLQLSSYMTFAQHNDLCERRERQASLELATLSTKLDEREKAALRYRENMQRELRELAIDIAVVQTEMHIRRRRKIAPEDAPIEGGTPT